MSNSLSIVISSLFVSVIALEVLASISCINGLDEDDSQPPAPPHLLNPSFHAASQGGVVNHMLTGSEMMLGRNHDENSRIL